MRRSMKVWSSIVLASANAAKHTTSSRICATNQQYSPFAHRLLSKHSVPSHHFALFPRTFSVRQHEQQANKKATSKNAQHKARATLKQPLPSKSIASPPTTAEHSEGGLQGDDLPLTWRDYDPAGGLPLRTEEFTQNEINSIFGSHPNELDCERGNYILNVIHYRRLSGSLIDLGVSFPPETGVTQQSALRALQYVRSLNPTFDENAAGQRWVEEETERLQGQLIQRAERLGIIKKIDVQQETSSDGQQGTAYGRERSGDSALIAMRQENEAIWEAEQAQKAAQAERQAAADLASSRGPLDLGGGIQPATPSAADGNDDVKVQNPPTSAQLQSVERKPWVKYYEERAQIIKDNAIPQLTTLRRLTPSLLLTATVVALCLFLSENYTPPPNSARMFPDTPPALTTLTAMVGLLCFGFLAGRFPPLWRTYSKYLTLVPAYPYAASLFGVIFRHDNLTHLAPNLAILWLLGLQLHEDVGRGTFLAIFISSGVVGALTSLTSSVLTKSWMHYIYGSSGAVLGVVAAVCTLHPTATISVAGYDLPIASWVVLALYSAVELYSLLRRRKGTTIDHAGHLGGITTGITAAFYLKTKARDSHAAEAIDE